MACAGNIPAGIITPDVGGDAGIRYEAGAVNTCVGFEVWLIPYRKPMCGLCRLNRN